jgi:hypothetical protein
MLAGGAYGVAVPPAVNFALVVASQTSLFMFNATAGTVAL